MKRSNFADPKEKLTDPLTFQITNIRHSDEKYENIDIDAEDNYDSEAEEERVTDSEKRYKIQLFGVTKGGHTVQVNICDFTPFFFVEVPDNFTEAKTKKFVKFVKNMLEVPNCKTCGHTFGPTERWCKTCNKRRGWFYQGNLLKKSCKLLEKEKMVGFTNHKKFKFIRLVFNNHTVMRRCSWMFNKPLAIEGVTNEPHQFVCHESNIEPVMRWLHIQKIEPAGWVTVNDFVELQPEYSTCNFLVRSSFMSVKPANDVEGIAPIMCAAFDIECTSKDGGFPKANRIEDAVIMVCTTFRKYPDTESCYKVCHTLKDSKPIEGCEIVLCKSEKDLLIKWRNLMQQMDPDFIYGYNSNGFDFKYMYDRAVLRRCESAWLEMSRCVYEPSKFELKKLSSSALGDNVHKFVDMKGRIVLDVMKEIQKEHKLDSYKLDAVAEHFTGDHKEDLSPQELFANYHKGKKKNIHEIAVYCLKDTELCHDLAFELAIVVKAMKMANVCTVPTEYIFYRGQGVKIFSLMAKECRKRGMIMPVIKRPYNDNTPEEQRDLFKKQEQFQGALVIETDGGLYYDPIVVLDFNSLYPSCQLGWNISHDTLVIDKKYDNLPGIKYETVSYTDYDGKQVDCRYVQNDGDTNKGLIPIVVGHLLDTRKAIKKKLKNAKNAMEALLLECEQLAFKVVANSMFGQTGAATSPIYLKHIAACTTAKGREMLYKAKNVAEAEFENVECVYGDTDSNFYKIKGLEYLEDKKKSLEEIRIAKLKVAIGVGHEMSTKINAAIGKPGIINFAYEKTFFPFLIVTKKRYYGILYEEDPTKGKPKVMGLAIKRRNYCKYTKEIMQGLLDKLMENVQVDPEDILGFIRKKLMKLIEEKVSFDELVITNTLRSEYKNPGSIAHKCLADRMVQRGETVNANDRIPYIYAMHAPIYNTRAKPRKQKIADIVEHPKYAKENGIKYDPEIYITGQIVEPVSQILGFVIDNPKEVFDEAIQECWKRKWKIYGPPVKAPIQRKAKVKPETKKAIKPKLVSISDSDSE